VILALHLAQLYGATLPLSTPYVNGAVPATIYI
jgi:hypothetical protein